MNNIFNIRVGKQPWFGQTGEKKGFAAAEREQHRGVCQLLRPAAVLQRKFATQIVAGLLSPRRRHGVDGNGHESDGGRHRESNEKV